VWDYVSVEMWPLTGPLSIHWMMDAWIWNIDGMRIGRGEPKYPEKKPFPMALFHNPLWSALELNSGDQSPGECNLDRTTSYSEIHPIKCTRAKIPCSVLYLQHKRGIFFPCQINIDSGIISAEPVYLLWKHSSRNWTYISTQCLGTAVPPTCYHCLILGNCYNIFSETVSRK